MQGVLSVRDEDGQRCVDIIEQAPGAFGFREFRKDAEDPGRSTWSMIFREDQRLEERGVARGCASGGLARRSMWLPTVIY